MGRFLAVASFHNNPDEHIDLTFNNVLNQTHQDWLLIVGDDFSNDPEFKRRLKRRVEEINDPRIIYYQVEKRRELYLYQNMFRHYQYDYYFDLDSDDVLDPHLFEIYANHFEAHPEVMSIFSDINQVDEDNNLEQWSIIPPVDDYVDEWRLRHTGEFWDIYGQRATQKMFGCGRAMRRLDTDSIPILKECKTATDTLFLMYNLNRGKHLHIPRRLYTYNNRAGSDSGFMTEQEHKDFNVNAIPYMTASIYGGLYPYADCWHATSAISTCEWLDDVNEFSLLTREDLSAEVQEKIRGLYPDKTIKFNVEHNNVIVVFEDGDKLTGLKYKRLSILTFNNNYGTATEADFNEFNDNIKSQVEAEFDGGNWYTFFRQCRYTHNTIGKRKPIEPRIVVILKDTIDTIEESEAVTELVRDINESGSTAYLIELKPTWKNLPHENLGAHNVAEPNVELLRKFIEAKQPDILYWDGSHHLSNSTIQWLTNNYWTRISSEEMLGENLAEKLLEVAIPEVPKCRFYHKSGPELHCDVVTGNWHAEFWKAGKRYWRKDLVTGLWARYSEGWYQEWECRVYNTDTGQLQYTLKPDLTHFGVHLESSSLGDTLSFMGQIEQMNSERDYERLAVRTHKQFLFDWEQLATLGIEKSEWDSGDGYPQNWQGVGVFQTKDECSNSERHPRDWRTIEMGAIAADQLGIKYVERRPTLAPIFLEKHPSADARGVCIATKSTAQAKYWNHPTGWQDLVNKFKSKGIPVYYISKEDTDLSDVEHIKDLVDVAQYMNTTNRLVGISSGLSWFAWALGIDVALISGFTWEFVEFNATVRIINRNVCSGCWTWSRFDRGDWNWCPQNKGNERHFECTKTITPEHVWQELETSGKFNI